LILFITFQTARGRFMSKETQTPYTDMTASAIRTLNNWGAFMAIQRNMQDIELARKSPLGVIIAPKLEEELYTSIINHCPSAKA